LKKILILSDLHLSPNRSVPITKIFYLLEKYSPDIIVINGDFFNSPFDQWSLSTKGSLADLKIITDKLKEYEVIYTPGNHDISFLANEYYEANEMFRFFENFSSIRKLFIQYLKAEKSLLVSLPYIIFSNEDKKQNYLSMIKSAISEIKLNSAIEVVQIMIFSHLDIFEFFPEKAKPHVDNTISLKDLSSVFREYFKKEKIYLFNGHIHQFRRYKNFLGFDEAINVGSLEFLNFSEAEILEVNSEDDLDLNRLRKNITTKKAVIINVSKNQIEIIEEKMEKNKFLVIKLNKKIEVDDVKRFVNKLPDNFEYIRLDVYRSFYSEVELSSLKSDGKLKIKRIREENKEIRKDSIEENIFSLQSLDTLKERFYKEILSRMSEDTVKYVFSDGRK